MQSINLFIMMKKLKTFCVIAILITMHLKSFSALGQQNSDVKDLFVSYYSDWFVGRHTSNGEIYRKNLYTAAHPNLPFGTKLKITNPNNGKTIIVKVNDRCAWVYGGKRFDLSYQAAKALDYLKAGVIRVKVEIVPEDAIVGVVPHIGPLPDINPTPNESTSVNRIVIKDKNIPEASNTMETINVGNNFAVQVGAYSVKNYAENIVKQLKKKGFHKIELTLDKEEVKAKYKVVINKGSNYDQAWEIAQKLEKMKVDYYIVRL